MIWLSEKNEEWKTIETNENLTFNSWTKDYKKIALLYTSNNQLENVTGKIIFIVALKTIIYLGKNLIRTM